MSTISGSSTTEGESNQSAQMRYEHWSVMQAMIQSCDWEDPPSQASSALFVGYFIVVYSYIVDGRHYRGEFYCSHEWVKEADLMILYNPQNPGESIACDDDDSESGAALEWILEFLVP